MAKIKKLKVMAFALSLSLCMLPLSAPLALAVDETVTGGSTGTPDHSNLEPMVDENGDAVDPGILPDSPFYWLTQLIDKLQVILTTDPVAKTELLEDQALEKMAEAEAMIESGDTKEAQVAMEGYTQKLTEAQAFLENLSSTDSETAQKLELALSQSHAKNIQTLGGILDKLPPQAQEKVALNIVRSMEKSIAKMEKKDQQKFAKELRKATEDIEENELTDEEKGTLDSLDETLDLKEEAVTLMLSTEKSKANSNRQIKASEPKLETELIEEEKLQEQNDGVEAEKKQQEQKQPEQKQVAPKENKVSKEKNQNSDKAKQKEAKER